MYRCDHCGKLYQRKHHASNHEKLCKKNIQNYRPCLGCPMLIKKETEIYFDTFDGEDKRKVNLLFCLYKNHFLFTPQNEIKKNYFELGDEENEPMPKSCDVDLDEELKKHYNF